DGWAASQTQLSRSGELGPKIRWMPVVTRKSPGFPEPLRRLPFSQEELRSPRLSKLQAPRNAMVPIAKRRILLIDDQASIHDDYRKIICAAPRVSENLAV